MEEKNSVPVIIGNAAPFRLVLRDTDKWEPTLDEVNSRSYDYVKLHRLSTYLDVGIQPFSLGVGFDGSLIIPATKEFQDKDAALDKFNQTLGQLLFGGIYSEAVLPEDIYLGILTFDGYFKAVSATSGSVGNFHKAIRTKHVGTLDVMRLLNPIEIPVSDLEQSLAKGMGILDKLPKLSSSLLLNGVTHFVKHQWAEALVFLWTSIEQVIGHIWNSEILRKRNDSGEEISGRKKFLQDYRTWSTSTKVEMLYQNSLIGSGEYQLLNNARKARNDFVHRAVKPTQINAESALDSLFQLVSLAVTEYKKHDFLSEPKELVMRNLRGELLPKKRSFNLDEVSHWLALPPIPGDVNWGDEPYEIIEELQLKPVEV